MKNNRVNIALLYPTLGHIGGAQDIVASLFSELTQEQVVNDVVVLVLKRKIANRYIFIKDKLFTILHIFKYARKKYIILANDRKTLLLAFLLKFLFYHSMKIIYIAHNIFNDKIFLTARPDFTIAVSNAVKHNLIEEFHFDEKKIKVIYNGIVDDNFSNLNRLKKTDGRIRILHIGRIEKVKQQIAMVEHLSGKILKTIEIHFAGDGSEAGKLESVIAKEKGNNFKYIGLHDNITQLIKYYDYVLLFSEKEGLGLTLIQACMMGVPVITSAIGPTSACGEICCNGKNGFLANTWDELIQCINNLENIDSDIYKEMSSNAREVYETKFTFRKMIDNYIEVITGI